MKGSSEKGKCICFKDPAAVESRATSSFWSYLGDSKIAPSSSTLLPRESAESTREAYNTSVRALLLVAAAVVTTRVLMALAMKLNPKALGL
jgi:hypothetical protein